MRVDQAHAPGRFLSPALARRLSALPPPIVVFNKSHSGSRLLARLLREQGIFMGAVLNESEDALPLLRLVEHVVLTYHPDFSPLWGQSPWPEALQQLISETLDAHLAGYQPGTAWGWKLCETTYILPLLAALFPTGRYIHLVRDGRDVASPTTWRQSNPSGGRSILAAPRCRAGGACPSTMPRTSATAISSTPATGWK